MRVDFAGSASFVGVGVSETLLDGVIVSILGGIFFKLNCVSSGSEDLGF